MLVLTTDGYVMFENTAETLPYHLTKYLIPAGIWLVSMKEAAKVWQDGAQAIIMPCGGAASRRGRGSAPTLIQLLGSQTAQQVQTVSSSAAPAHSAVCFISRSVAADMLIVVSSSAMQICLASGLAARLQSSKQSINSSAVSLLPS